MELKELKKKSEKDLHKMLADDRAKLRELRFKDANKQLKNVREIRALRKNIAQIFTLLKNIRDNHTTEVKQIPSGDEAS